MGLYTRKVRFADVNIQEEKGYNSPKGNSYETEQLSPRSMISHDQYNHHDQLKSKCENIFLEIRFFHISTFNFFEESCSVSLTTLFSLINNIAQFRIDILFLLYHVN